MPDYLLHLRPRPGAVPPEVQLRRALKALWRQHRLRCVEVREVKSKEPEHSTPKGNVVLD